MINNKRCIEKVCYNINMIDSIEVNKIEEFKIEIKKNNHTFNKKIMINII